MRPFIFATLLVMASGAWHTAAAAAPSADEVVELQKQARAKIRVIDYEHAIPLLVRALTGKLSQSQKEELNVNLGICYASIGQAENARSAFDAALSANILIDLPVGTSPKIRQLFEGVRNQRHSKPTETTAVALRPAEPSWHIMPVEYLLSGAVVAGVAAGIVTGVVSSGAASDLESSKHDRSTADSLVSKQRNYGIASICSYGIAGAAAIGELSLILFWKRKPDPPPGKVTVHGVFLPGGAGAMAQVRF